MKRVQGFFDAFNSGDVARMHAFRAENWAVSPDTPPEEERDRRYRQMRADAGDVIPVGLLAYGDAEVTLLVKTGRGEMVRSTFGFTGEDRKLAFLEVEAGN